MDDPKDWLTPENLLRRFLQLVILAITALVSATSKDFHAFLETLALKLPPLLLLTTSILLLLVLTALVAYLGYLLVVTRRDNKRLSQTPQFYAAFGAKWKYWPYKKIFEQAPFCPCCDPPSLCYVRPPFDDTKVEHLICPLRDNQHRDAEFHLRDTQGNWLGIKDALVRLEQMEVPHGN